MAKWSRPILTGPDPVRLRRRRRFQTSKPLLLFLGFSTLDAHRLTWSDAGHHPDCPFASFIHASQQQEPTWDPIIDTRRKCRSWLRSNSPDYFFPEACTKRCNEYSIFKPGLLTTKRREGDEHTLRGLAGVYQCRINILVVSSNHHHTKTTPLPSRNNHLVTVSLISPMFKATLSTIYISRVL